MSRKRISKKMIHQITQQRIKKLFVLARSQVKNGNLSLAHRYVEHARNLSKKNVSSIPSDLKHQYCPHCHAYLYPSLTCKVRIHRGKIIKYCFQCKKIMRIPIK